MLLECFHQIELCSDGVLFVLIVVIMIFVFVVIAVIIIIMQRLSQTELYWKKRVSHSKN